MNRKRRRLGTVQYLERLGRDLYFTSRNFCVLSTGRAASHETAGCDDILRPKRRCKLSCRGRVARIEDDLCNAKAVAHVDKDQPAVVTSTVDPAFDFNGCTVIFAGQLTAGNATHLAHLNDRTFQQCPLDAADIVIL